MLQQLRKRIIEGKHMPAIRVEESDKHVCLNCGTEYRGNFCPGCHQKASTKRLNMADTVKNGIGKLFSFDRGFLHTVVDLLYRPGYMVRDYIRGCRTEYTDPLVLMIILLAIDILIPDPADQTTASSMPDNYQALLASHPVSLQLIRFWYWIMGDDQRMAIWFGCVVATSITITQRLILLKKDLLNLSESFHLVMYGLCYISLLAIIFGILYLVFPALNTYNDSIMSCMICFLFILLYVMVYQNTSMPWWRYLLFVLMSPVGFAISMLIMFGTMKLILWIDLPAEVFSQIHFTDA